MSNHGRGTPGIRRLGQAREGLVAQARKKVSPFFVVDAAFTFLAKRIPGVDGIWWDDSYDPGNLSAPRVGIFPEQVKRLLRKRRVIILA